MPENEKKESTSGHDNDLQSFSPLQEEDKRSA
jgi:hypothetical protein